MCKQLSSELECNRDGFEVTIPMQDVVYTIADLEFIINNINMNRCSNCSRLNITAVKQDLVTALRKNSLLQHHSDNTIDKCAELLLKDLVERTILIN